MKNPLLLLMVVGCGWLPLQAGAASEKTENAGVQVVSKVEPANPWPEETGNAGAQVRVVAEFIEVSQPQFTALLCGGEPAANDTELRSQVAKLIDEGKASVVETMMATALSGDKATSESLEEFTYPSDYAPAVIPEYVNAKDTGQTVQPDLSIAPSPTQFMNRNMGSSFEITPVINPDGKTVQVALLPEIVCHVGNFVWAEWKGQHGNSPIQMPTFYTLRVQTKVTLTHKRVALVAALSPKDADGHTDGSRKLMVFVTAEIIRE